MYIGEAKVALLRIMEGSCGFSTLRCCVGMRQGRPSEMLRDLYIFFSYISGGTGGKDIGEIPILIDYAVP